MDFEEDDIFVLDDDDFVEEENLPQNLPEKPAELFLISIFHFLIKTDKGEIVLPFYVTDNLNLIKMLDFKGVNTEECNGYYLVPSCARVVDKAIFNKMVFQGVQVFTINQLMDLEIEDALEDYYIYITKMLTHI